jgi:virginiamycin A acetyltransferase
MEFKDRIYPITTPDGTVWPNVVFLKNVINHSQVEVGDYSYYNDFQLKYGDNYGAKLAPYLIDKVSPEKLIIGKFCQIAHGTTFITSSANHQYSGFSTYPFAVFGEEWSKSYSPDYKFKDTIVGNDVWFGHNVTIMPGVNIGSGVIIGSCSVVTKDVPNYTIVAGNPAKVVRQRFDNETIGKLMEVAWWNWPDAKIFVNIKAIVGSDVRELIKANS